MIRAPVGEIECKAVAHGRIAPALNIHASTKKKPIVMVVFNILTNALPIVARISLESAIVEHFSIVVAELPAGGIVQHAYHEWNGVHDGTGCGHYVFQ